MDTLVVQMGVKHGRVAELTRSHDGSLSVGRSYDNDLVLTDRHVAPRQIEFFQQDGQWHLRVLDRTNPVMLNNKIVDTDIADVVSGDKVTIGRTRLSIYSTAGAVEPTTKLLLSNWLARDPRSSWLPLLVFLAVCLVDFLITFFEGSTDLKWQEDMRSELFAGICILLWAGLWALAGRIIRQQHHMGLQLMATTSAYVLAIIAGLLSIVIAGSTHSVILNELILYLLFFGVLVVLFRLNLLIATNVQRTLAVAVVLAASVISVIYALNSLSGSDEFQQNPDYSSELVPPIIQFDARTTADKYFSTLNKEMQNLDLDD